MQLRTYQAQLLLIGVLFSAVCSTVSYGQELEHEEEKETKSEKDRAIEKNIDDVMAGRKRFLTTDLMIRATDRTMYELENPNLQPTTFVDFGPKAAGGRKIEFTNNYTYGRFNVADLNRSDELFNDRDSFVLSGSFTRADVHWFESRGLSFAIWSKYSPKLHGSEAVAALALTHKKFNSNEVSLFDALPSETGTVRGQLELSRMGLPKGPKDWLAARQQIRAAAHGLPIHTATKPALVKELREGTSTFLLVIAHSDSNSLYLPGINGGRLSTKELMQIQRQDAPDRVIVLLACKVGGVNNEVGSIAEIIVHNKLATAVLAASDYVYAMDLSSMIAAFVTSGKLVGAFPGLKTIVENKSPSDGDTPLGVASTNFALRWVTDEFYR